MSKLRHKSSSSNQKFTSIWAIDLHCEESVRAAQYWFAESEGLVAIRRWPRGRVTYYLRVDGAMREDTFRDPLTGETISRCRRVRWPERRWLSRRLRQTRGQMSDLLAAPHGGTA